MFFPFVEVISRHSYCVNRITVFSTLVNNIMAIFFDKTERTIHMLKRKKHLWSSPDDGIPALTVRWDVKFLSLGNDIIHDLLYSEKTNRWFINLSLNIIIYSILPFLVISYPKEHCEFTREPLYINIWIKI